MSTHPDLDPSVGDGAVDDEGRDEARASTMQARMFAGLAAFSVLAAIVYGALSHEPAGTTLLVLTGGLTGLCGLYISWHRPGHVDEASGHGDANAVDESEPWFPHASPWPFAIAVSVVLMGNAMLLGLWLILPAGVLLIASIAGFAAQSRNRS
ncbi:MAG: hypothetical protein JWM34_4405 [Ilumatobacteraceae bacterium]|nr:hypothetical protein [Ilumatobacteraceae bacterium]